MLNRDSLEDVKSKRLRSRFRSMIDGYDVLCAYDRRILLIDSSIDIRFHALTKLHGKVSRDCIMLFIRNAPATYIAEFIKITGYSFSEKELRSVTAKDIYPYEIFKSVIQYSTEVPQKFLSNTFHTKPELQPDILRRRDFIILDDMVEKILRVHVSRIRVLKELLSRKDYIPEDSVIQMGLSDKNQLIVDLWKSKIAVMQQDSLQDCEDDPIFL